MTYFRDIYLFISPHVSNYLFNGSNFFITFKWPRLLISTVSLFCCRLILRLHVGSRESWVEPGLESGVPSPSSSPWWDFVSCNHVKGPASRDSEPGSEIHIVTWFQESRTSNQVVVSELKAGSRKSEVWNLKSGGSVAICCRWFQEPGSKPRMGVGRRHTPLQHALRYILGGTGGPVV